MLAYRGYRHALGYARERRQGRAPGTRGGPPLPLVEHADVRRMLLSLSFFLSSFSFRRLCLHNNAAAERQSASLRTTNSSRKQQKREKKGEKKQQQQKAE